MARLYVLIRSDIPKNYQAVQAGHAVAQFVLDYPDSWKNETLVYLRVKDQSELKEYLQRFAESNSKFAEFQEPDLYNETTAIAVLSNPIIENTFTCMKLV